MGGSEPRLREPFLLQMLVRGEARAWLPPASGSSETVAWGLVCGRRRPPGRSLPLTAPGAKTALLRFWQSTGARNCACRILAIYFPVHWTRNVDCRFRTLSAHHHGALLGCSGAGGPVCATSPRATVWATRGGPSSSVGAALGPPRALPGCTQGPRGGRGLAACPVGPQASGITSGGASASRAGPPSGLWGAAAREAPAAESRPAA